MAIPQETIALLWIATTIFVIVGMALYAGIYGALAAIAGALIGLACVNLREYQRQRGARQRRRGNRRLK